MTASGGSGVECRAFPTQPDLRCETREGRQSGTLLPFAEAAQMTGRSPKWTFVLRLHCKARTEGPGGKLTFSAGAS